MGVLTGGPVAARRAPLARGLESLASEEVSRDAPWRLYRARASAMYVLEDEHDRRVAVQLAR